jgi:hypothetical protein
MALATSGRAKIVFAHHSRLSHGKHGDVEDVDGLWQALFDDHGAPLAALSMAGHDHNVRVYGPRPSKQPEKGSVDFSRGIHIVVNGAGGRGHDVAWRGTPPDLHPDDDNYFLTRIALHYHTRATLEFLDFGPRKALAITTPAPRFTLQLQV